MFDFQKEVVLNSLKDVKDFGATVRVDGMLYKKEYMGDVFKTVAVEGTPAKLVINIAEADAAVTNVMQFVIELGLDNDYRGDFGSVLYYFRKPIVVTLAKGTSAEDVAKAFKKAGFVDYKLYDVEVEGSVVTLTMVDNYITVRKAEVMDWECSETSCNSESVEIPVSRLDLMDGYTKNVVGFGTYEYMIHNLRLPTHANIRFASPAEAEMPVKGGKYTQFSFEYTVPRRLGGLSVAGQKTESTTIHTFFVLESGDNVATFESYLAKPANEDTPEDNTENTEE
jgi:rhodanese-related sulfurtransferase